MNKSEQAKRAEEVLQELDAQIPTDWIRPENGIPIIAAALQEAERRGVEKMRPLAIAAEKLIASWKGFECPVCGEIDDCKLHCPWMELVVAFEGMPSRLLSEKED